MKLTEYLKKELIFNGLTPSDKSSLIKQLAMELANKYKNISRPDELIQSLLEREEENSTGVGNQIAIPHAMNPDISETLCVVGQIPNGLDFDAMDNKPVKLVFMLVSPPGKVSEHIRLLARITRIIKDPNIVEQIAQSSNSDEIYSIIKTEDEKHV